MPDGCIARIDSSTPEYSRAFHAFLAHTDQKSTALAWLEKQVAELPQHNVAIDAGAGTGTLAAWLVERFATVIGVEPNPSLADEFRATCPTATLIPQSITIARPDAPADFVLCSHVFYYIPRNEWDAALRHLLRWIAPTGTLIVALQSAMTDCSQMIADHGGKRSNLRDLEAIATELPSDRYQVHLATVPATVRAPDLATALQIAEFFLSNQPLANPPRRSELHAYLSARFQQPDGSYALSCDQEFLRIARRSQQGDCTSRAHSP